MQIPPRVLRRQRPGESRRPDLHGLLHSKGSRWVDDQNKQKQIVNTTMFRGGQQGGGEGESGRSRGSRV